MKPLFTLALLFSCAINDAMPNSSLAQDQLPQARYFVATNGLPPTTHILNSEDLKNALKNICIKTEISPIKAEVPIPGILTAAAGIAGTFIAYSGLQSFTHDLKAHAGGETKDMKQFGADAAETAIGLCIIAASCFVWHKYLRTPEKVAIKKVGEPNSVLPHPMQS